MKKSFAERRARLARGDEEDPDFDANSAQSWLGRALFAGNSLGLGFMDEALGAGDYAVSNTLGLVDSEWADRADNLGGFFDAVEGSPATQAYRDAERYYSTNADIGDQLATGLAGAAPWLAVPALAGGRAMGLAGRAGIGAAEGAGYGGVYGFGSAEGSAEDRADDALIGALVGGGLGAGMRGAFGKRRQAPKITPPAAPPVAPVVQMPAPMPVPPQAAMPPYQMPQQAMPQAAGIRTLGMTDADRGAAARLGDIGQSGRVEQSFVIGERGIRNLPRFRDALPRARELRRRGMDDERIFDETGLRFDPETKQWTAFLDPRTLKSETLPDGTVRWSHDELEQAYPGMADRWTVTAQEGVGGATAPRYYRKGGRIAISRDYDGSDKKNVLAHELQHAEQYESGRAARRNPRSQREYETSPQEREARQTGNRAVDETKSWYPWWHSDAPHRRAKR